jgi:tetratricopeptide (TPR) repeat protein
MNRLYTPLFVLLIALAGCKEKKSQPKPKAQAPAPVVSLQDVLKSSKDATVSGDAKGAAAMVNQALNRMRDEMDRVALFRHLTRIYLHAKQYPQAQETVLRLQKESPDAAGSLYGMVGKALIRADQAGNAVAWYNRVLGSELKPDARAALLAMKADALRVDGRFHAALDLITYCDRQYSPETAQSIAEQMVFRLLWARRYDQLRRLTDFIREVHPHREGFRELTVFSHMVFLANTGKPKDAVNTFREQSGQLSDVYLAQAAQSILRRTRKDPNLSDQLCAYVIDELGTRPRVIQAIAATYMRSASKHHTPQVIVDRLEQLSKTRLNTQQKLRQVTGYAYTIMGTEDKALMKRFADVGQGLLTRDVKDRRQLTLARQLFDCRFLLDDLDGAGDLFEVAFSDDRTGDPKKYEAIHHKFQAHIATRDKKYKEAIDHIQAFITWVKADTNPTPNPMTNGKVPKGLVLGLNNKRIGDLLMKLEEKEAARESYDEAIAHYEAGLKELDKASPQYKRAQAELNKIPRK